MITTIDGIEFEEINYKINEKTKPKLSVWSIAYNEKEFIKDCLDGILSQIVDFEIEILIFDDASTDGTTDIIREYCELYPDIIHAFIAKENTYKKPNTVEMRTHIKERYLRGEYIAVCECDDYWCDKQKLQMQVDFLEKNKDFVLTMHNAKKIDYETGECDLVKPVTESSHEINSDEIIMQETGMWPTASMVGRKAVLLCAPFFYECGIGDWSMQLFSITLGKIYYFENVMSVYRYKRSGSWSEKIGNSNNGQTMHFIKLIHFLDQYNKYTNHRYDEIIVGRQRSFYNYLVECNKIEESFFKEFEEKQKEINNVCDDDNAYWDIVKKLERIYRQYDKDYVSEETKAFALKHRHLLIYGAGNYAGKMAHALTVNNIQFEGFVVSDDRENDDFYLEKPVFKVSNIPYRPEEYGVIVAIDLVWKHKWEEMRLYIESKGVKEYIYPYDIF